MATIPPTQNTYKSQSITTVISLICNCTKNFKPFHQMIKDLSLNTTNAKLGSRIDQVQKLLAITKEMFKGPELKMSIATSKHASFRHVVTKFYKLIISSFDCNCLKTILNLESLLKCDEMNLFFTMTEKALQKRIDNLLQIQHQVLIQNICKKLEIDLGNGDVALHYDSIKTILSEEFCKYLAHNEISERLVYLFITNQLIRPLLRDILNKREEIDEFNFVLDLYRYQKLGTQILDTAYGLLPKEQFNDIEEKFKKNKYGDFSKSLDGKLNQLSNSLNVNKTFKQYQLVDFQQSKNIACTIALINHQNSYEFLERIIKASLILDAYGITTQALSDRSQIERLNEAQKTIDPPKKPKPKEVLVLESQDIKIEKLIINEAIEAFIESLECKGLVAILRLNSKPENPVLCQLMLIASELLKKRQKRLSQIQEIPLVNTICVESKINLPQDTIETHYDSIKPLLEKELLKHLTETWLTKDEIALFVNLITRNTIIKILTEKKELEKEENKGLEKFLLALDRYANYGEKISNTYFNVKPKNALETYDERLDEVREQFEKNNYGIFSEALSYIFDRISTSLMITKNKSTPLKKCDSSKERSSSLLSEIPPIKKRYGSIGNLPPISDAPEFSSPKDKEPHNEKTVSSGLYDSTETNEIETSSNEDHESSQKFGNYIDIRTSSEERYHSSQKLGSPKAQMPMKWRLRDMLDPEKLETEKRSEQVRQLITDPTTQQALKKLLSERVDLDRFEFVLDVKKYQIFPNEKQGKDILIKYFSIPGRAKYVELLDHAQSGKRKWLGLNEETFSEIKEAFEQGIRDSIFDKALETVLQQLFISLNRILNPSQKITPNKTAKEDSLTEVKVRKLITHKKTCEKMRDVFTEIQEIEKFEFILAVNKYRKKNKVDDALEIIKLFFIEPIGTLSKNTYLCVDERLAFKVFGQFQAGITEELFTEVEWKILGELLNSLMTANSITLTKELMNLSSSSSDKHSSSSKSKPSSSDKHSSSPKSKPTSSKSKRSSSDKISNSSPKAARFFGDTSATNADSRRSFSYSSDAISSQEPNHAESRNDSFSQSEDPKRRSGKKPKSRSPAISITSAVDKKSKLSKSFTS